MNVVQPKLQALSSATLKMEERKRPAADPEEHGPPLKKQSTGVNGTQKKEYSDMPGQDDLERFQKDAIYREMLFFKREKISLESQLEGLTKKTRHHDEHIRSIDAWFSQLLDEVKVLMRLLPEISSHQPFPSSLLSVDNKTFENFLKGRAEQIASSISRILTTSSSTASATSPTPPSTQISDPQVIEYVKELQLQYSKAIASDRLHVNEVEQERLENSRLQEQVENATMRYMVAEKKLDRSKSITVQKLERQAISGGKSDAGSGLGGGTDSGKQILVNGQVDSSEKFVVMENTLQETLAASTKLQEQIDQLTTDNATLGTQNTELISKASRHTDDDYAHTDLFKHLKTVHDDNIRRLNDLEATNVQLQKEAENLQSERASYRTQLETEAQAVVSEKEIQLTQAESDLARVRTARDELSAELQIKKAAQEQVNTSEKHSKELLEAREKRISVLESEIDRLRISLGEKEASAGDAFDLESLSLNDIRLKYSAKVEQYDMLTKELSSMDLAYRKAAKLASAKLEELRALEDKVGRLTAEKAKADQKYFGAMKAKEAQLQELRTLRAQNSRSSNVMAQLKETDRASAAMVVSLEKQSKESASALQKVVKANNESQQKLTKNSIITDGMKTQIDNLKQALVTKDTAHQQLASKGRQADVELEELRVRIESTKKDASRYKASAAGKSKEDDETYRKLIICSVCHVEFKDRMVKQCGHMLCHGCIETRITSRMRKCPTCGVGFGQGDIFTVTM